MEAVMKLRDKNKNLKILLTFLPKGNAIRDVIYDEEKFNNMIISIFNFVKFSNLDGFDLDWEFPAWGPGAKSIEKEKFSYLIQKLSYLFNQDPSKKYLLTAAVAGPYTIAYKSYDFYTMNKYLDFIQIMNYDFHIFSKIEPFVGFNAPLHAEKFEIFIAGRMNSAYTTEYYLKNGISSKKLVFGIPTYGRGFKLLEKHLHFLYAPAIGPSFLGSSYSYAESCKYLEDRNFTYVWKQNAATGYLYNNDRDWIGLETEESIKEKASYAASKKLGGIMIFALYEDDYKGVCPGSKGVKMFLTNTAKNTFIEVKRKLNFT
uniref:Glyco_18 domain-containing protein n=1 Tax=Parastrongyloides trichosuri TaxID=131310 RepID=A0A0N4Z258_PARTI